METSRPHLFNTLTRKVEPFVPVAGDLRGGRPTVGLYCCGPTVYDYGHIGNFRTFVFADLVRRYLDYRGFEVNHVMNITDVEDKIIRRVRETGKSLKEFTGHYEREFLKDLQTLNCRLPTSMPRATEYIASIIGLITRLEERGIAYRAADGSVYFSIQRYEGCGCRYGQLLNLNTKGMRTAGRVSSDEYDKESVADFALWKARVPEDGEVFWDSPWGQGRPGWHVECSAMSMALLGPSFDIHLGGEDLVFPHHEDEIAQSEGTGLQSPGRPFVRYWLHVAHLLVEGKKMSKSLGNFFTVRDLLAKGFSGREIRQLLLSANFRETFNFTLEGLEGARSALARIDECLSKLSAVAGSTSHSSGAISPWGQAFTRAMDDDLNVSKAWAIVFEWIREMNRVMAAARLTPSEAATELQFWHQVDQVFGIGARDEVQVPQDIQLLAQQRLEAKAVRDFGRADVIRGELKSKGWVVEDTPSGPKFKRVGS